MKFAERQPFSADDAENGSKIANRNSLIANQETGKELSSDIDHQEWSVDDELAKELLSGFLN